MRLAVIDIFLFLWYILENFEGAIMIKCDLHTHTLKSRCGYCSPLEMMNQAADLGLDALAITDHGTYTGGYISHALFRLPDMYRGVRVLKGVEVTICEDAQKIGLPAKYLHNFDLVISGFHNALPESDNPKKNNEYLIRYLDAHPYIDIISHPGSNGFPLDMSSVIPELIPRGVAFELNNAKLAQGKADLEQLRVMVEMVVTHQGRLVLNSDAHTVFEVGQDDAIRAFLDTLTPVPESCIVNRNLESVVAFIEERKPAKFVHKCNKGI